MNLTKAAELRASEILKLDSPVPEHLDIMAMDVEHGNLFSSPILKSVISLDISRLGVDDTDVIELSESNNLPKIKWLSLAGNRISREGVRAICRAIKEGRFDLIWLDLCGTEYDATPYLDGDNGETAYWRIPRAGHELYKEFGYQYWMTLGRPVEKEYSELVEVVTFWPDRFSM